jgi:glycosyltransferase involved in cell wall biosynthesis
MNKSLVTISIPTFNSEYFIKTCLAAVKKQTYKYIEVNIIDGGSSDHTIQIARDEGIENIFYSKDALLEARYQGVKRAKGEYILLLDSDQILNETTVDRAYALCRKKGHDMLILEEGVYEPESFIEKLFQEDRKLIHSVKDISPYTGVMLPRFYRRDLLLKAMNNIPVNIRKSVGGQDHAIIYFEVWKLSQKVGMLHHAVNHIEPDSLKKIWKKFFRWGATSVSARYGKYDTLLKKKERFRTGMFRKGKIKESIASIVLLFLKGIPYKLGCLFGRN